MMTVEDLLSKNPFPGLRAFAPGEADCFFGRDRQIEELVARLNEVSFLTVAGSSGCGKSSLVCAGLLGELARRTTAGSDTVWHYAIMRPGNQPIANLAEKLAPVLGGGSGSEEWRKGALYGRLRLGDLGLVEAVRLARLSPKTRVLVVVDQFEEIFRFKRMIDPDEASAFVKLLLHATRDRESPVSVIITLRSEDLGYCAAFRDLPEIINRGQYLVPKLTQEQRKEAIIAPVEMRGFKVAPRLVQRLLNDIPDDFDDLPVMQHTLTRTWSSWAKTCQGSRPIDLEDYEAVGTCKEALSNHADEAFNSLPGLGHVIEKVFRALTMPVAEGTEIRRPLDFNLLCQVIGGERSQVEQVVERFRRPDTTFLLPPKDQPLEDNPVIDISHESLIRLWHRLPKWTSAEAESRAQLLKQVEAARQYEATQGSLWRGRDLETAHEWQQSAQPTPAWVGLYTGGDGTAPWQSVEQFIARSDEDVRRERLRWKSLVWGVRGLAIAVVFIFIIAAHSQYHKAKNVQSNLMANKALLEINQDPARSAQIALAGVELDSKNERAEYALRQSLATLEVAHCERILARDDLLSDDGEPVEDARYTLKGTRLVIASGKTVTIFDTKTFERKEVIKRNALVLKAWLIANDSILVTHTYDDHDNSDVQIQRVGESSTKSISCEGEKNRVYTVGVSPDERYIALGCYNGDVQVFDKTGTAERPPKSSHKVKGPVTITALAFSADSKYLASGDADGIVNVWKLGHSGVWIGQGASGAKVSPISHSYGYAIRDIGFHSEDPSLLVTAADDSYAIVWSFNLDRRELYLGKNSHWDLKHDRPVTAAKFASGDLKYAVFTVSDKKVRFWVNPTPDWRQIRNHEDWVRDANVSPKGELLVTSSADGTARLWSTRSRTPVAVLRGHRDDVTRAVISPAGDQVMTASADGTVRIWWFRPSRLLSSSKKWTLSAAFDPEGKRVALGGEEGISILEMNGLAGDSTPNRSEMTRKTSRFWDDAFSHLSWSRNGKFIAGRISSPGLNFVGHAALWDVESKREITPAWLKKQIMAVFSPGTDELVTVGDKGQIAVCDANRLTSTDPCSELIGEKPRRWMAVISPDGKWIAALSGKEVELWKRGESQARPREMKHKGDVTSLQFSRDSKWLLTASRDRTARIWPVDTSGDEKVLSGHSLSLASASFDPKGERVVTGSADGTIRVWDAKTGRELAALHWHNEGVNQVQFSPNDNKILSASDDGTVMLGQCDTCALTNEELRQRVNELAKLPSAELKEINADAQDYMQYLYLPSLYLKLFSKK